MIKNIKLYSLLTTMAFLGSCESLLDVNNDPLAATEVQFEDSPELLFTRIQAELGAERILESGNVFSFFSQHIGSAGSAGVFIDPERYEVPQFPGVVTWGTYYINLLKNLKLGIDLAEAADKPNISALYKTMQAYIFYHITISWEDAPFSEAIDFDIVNPQFDSQETILRGLVDLLDEALALYDTDPSAVKVEDQDFIYGGDISQWVKFTNSLKLKILMLIVNQDDSAAITDQISALVSNTDNLIVINADNAELEYGEDLTNANQLWRLHNQFAGGTSAFINATTTILDIMEGLDDPRIPTYFDEGSGADPEEFIGTPPGAAANRTNIADLSLNFIRETFPDRWITAGEINLLMAEAVQKGYATGNAQNLYEEGVRQSMAYFDGIPGAIAAGDQAAYIDNLPSVSLENIYTQQYLDLFLRGVESWTNIRRTGFPDLPLPEGAVLSDLIRRLPWPSDAIPTNPNFPAQPLLTEPMWFEGN